MKIPKNIKINDILLVSDSKHEMEFLYEILKIKKKYLNFKRIAGTKNHPLFPLSTLYFENGWDKIKIIPQNDLILYSYFSYKFPRYYELL